MIHRVYSNLPPFKNLVLKPGLNVLVADKTAQSTDRQTRNRAGKSSLVEIIHFLLGARCPSASIFRNVPLKDHRFGLDFDLAGQRIAVERGGFEPNKLFLTSGSTDRWRIRPTRDSLLEEGYLSNTNWRSVLGELMFGLRGNDEETQEKFEPTFRSLFSYFARRESEGGFREPQKQSEKQKLWDQQVAVTFLLGLDWAIAREWQLVRERERMLVALRQAAQDGALGSLVSTAAELRTKLTLAEQASERLRASLSSFQVVPEYRELEVEASRLTRELGALADANTLDRELAATLENSLRVETPPVPGDLERLYREAGVTLASAVTRRFEQVQAFHESIVRNRRTYLEAEKEEASRRLAMRGKEMQRLDLRRSEIMRILQSGGALDQYARLQTEASRQDAETESLRQRFQAAEMLEGQKTELGIERGRLTQRLRRDLEEQDSLVREVIRTFESVSRSLYEDAGSLTLPVTENGLSLQITIQGQRSRGIKNMQIFCFDMMLMKLCARRGMGPRLLVHDSHLFDGVDGRQVATALKVGAETAEQCDWQYLVTMNSDTLPASLPTGFRLDNHVLPVRLTDTAEDGGLFGIRF